MELFNNIWTIYIMELTIKGSHLLFKFLNHIPSEFQNLKLAQIKEEFESHPTIGRVEMTRRLQPHWLPLSLQRSSWANQRMNTSTAAYLNLLTRSQGYHHLYSKKVQLLELLVLVEHRVLEAELIACVGEYHPNTPETGF